MNEGRAGRKPSASIVIFVALLITIFCAWLVRAQGNVTDDISPNTYLPADSAKSDSLPHPAVRRLLPDNMSFTERNLWGEHGVLRSVGIASPLTPEVRRSELSLRRTMLTFHQIGGLVTLGLLGVTLYAGQEAIDGHRNFRGTHQTFVTATIISYGATGALAVLSPPPFLRRDETSTTTIHKTLAWVHFAGMIITPILGSTIGRHTDSSRAHVHQVAGYITAATLAISMAIVTF